MVVVVVMCWHDVVCCSVMECVGCIVWCGSMIYVDVLWCSGLLVVVNVYCDG